METQRHGCGVVSILFLSLLLQSATIIEAQSGQLPDSQAAQAAPGGQDSQSSHDQDQDPTGRIARLNLIDGAVSFQPGGENEWFDAALNRPLVSGDNLWADKDSRAEVHIGSTAFRLGPMTGITLLEVSDHVTQIRLVQGALIVRPKHIGNDDKYEVDTPNVALVLTQSGDYRLDVDPDSARTDITVWRGRGEVTGGGSVYTILPGQHGVFMGADQVSYAVHEIPGDDGFDNWALDRDRREDESDSANYVSRDMTGYEDLDQYGDWTYVPGYGMTWIPRAVAEGWAPYRFGHWVSIAPWGWTWVADEPWGFAPFHYGRWAFVGANWIWVPGSAAVRPIYAPAQVAWVGGARGTHFSFGAGVGWVPLAPGEVFVPYYRASRNYLNTVNLTNTHVEITRIANVYNTIGVNRAAAGNEVTYANRSVNGGVTVVSRETFVNSQSVGRNLVMVPATELASVPVSHEVSVEPVRASAAGAAKPFAGKPPEAMINRQVVSLRTPAPMARSFDQGEAHSAVQPSQSRLVRLQPAGTPVPVVSLSTHQTQMHEEVQPLSSTSATEKSTRAKASHVWEEQGTSVPENSGMSQSGEQAQAHHGQSSRMGASTHPHPPARSAHSLPKPATVSAPKREQEQEPKYSSWHQKSWSSSTQHSSSSAPAKSTTSSTHK